MMLKALGGMKRAVEEAGERRHVTHPAAQIEVPAAHLLEEGKPGAQHSCLGSRLLRPG